MRTPAAGSKYEHNDHGTRRRHEAMVYISRSHRSALFLVVNSVGLKLIIAQPQVGVFPSATPFTNSSDSVCLIADHPTFNTTPGATFRTYTRSISVPREAERLSLDSLMMFD